MLLWLGAAAPGARKAWSCLTMMMDMPLCIPTVTLQFKQYSALQHLSLKGVLAPSLY